MKLTWYTTPWIQPFFLVDQMGLELKIKDAYLALFLKINTKCGLLHLGSGGNSRGNWYYHMQTFTEVILIPSFI